MVMADEPPHTVVEATGKAASDVVAGLKNSPALLSLVVLNVVGLALAMWFLTQLLTASHEHRDKMLALIEKCMSHQGLTNYQQNAKE